MESSQPQEENIVMHAFLKVMHAMPNALLAFGT